MKPVLLILSLFSVFTQAQQENTATRLSQYKDVTKVIKLAEVPRNLSGITYNYDTDTYFLIQNKQALIYEYSNDFSKLLRKITLVNPADIDTEDIVYLGNNEFAISDEANYVTIFTLPSEITTLNLGLENQDMQRMRLPRPGKGNKGMEGVCFTRSEKEKGTFFSVQEDRPKRVFKWNRPESKNHITNESMLNWIEPYDVIKHLSNLMNDLSACTFDDQSGHLIVLSDESARAIELDQAGVPVKTLDLSRAAAGQYEGITIGSNNELILVSEPNVVVIMEPIQTSP